MIALYPLLYDELPRPIRATPLGRAGEESGPTANVTPKGLPPPILARQSVSTDNDLDFCILISSDQSRVEALSGKLTICALLLIMSPDHDAPP